MMQLDIAGGGVEGGGSKCKECSERSKQLITDITFLRYEFQSGGKKISFRNF